MMTGIVMLHERLPNRLKCPQGSTRVFSANMIRLKYGNILINESYRNEMLSTL